MNISKKYMILDEVRNASDYLNKSLLFIKKINIDLVYLKWFTIAFHGAIYSFMLLKAQSIKAEYIFSDNKLNTHSLDRNLKSFKRIYLLLKNVDVMSENVYIPDKNVDACIFELNDQLRNQMIHFRPTLWASEPWYFARACYPLLHLLRFCIQNNHLLNKEGSSLLRVAETIEKKLKVHYD